MSINTIQMFSPITSVRNIPDYTTTFLYFEPFKAPEVAMGHLHRIAARRA